MAISVGGLMSGLDTNSIVDQMLDVQQQPILSLQQDEAEYQVELTMYGSLKSTLSSLQSAMEKLESPDDLTRFSAASGDNDLFTVSADETASTGSYNVTVSQLADVHKLTSSAFATDETMGEGTLHLKVGSATATDISVSATDTIDDVAQTINDADAGVSAAVVYDGTNYFLTLSAEDTGTDNVINLTATETGTAQGDPENTDTTGLSRLVYDQGVTTNMTNTQSAADAIISVDGVSNIHRSSNEIDDVLEGVTLTLKSAPASPDNSTSLSVTRNTGTVSSGINSFVSAYNSAMTFIENQQSYDATTGDAGVFLGDATTNSIRNTLKNLISGTVSGAGSIDQLADVGVTLNGEGRLEVDSETLNDALKNNFDDVIQFFSQTTSGSEGFAVKTLESLDTILDSSTGTLTARTSGIQESIEDIQDKVDTLEMRNLAWEERTRAQFNALELLLSEYQSTGDYLTQQITGFQNFNSYVSNR